MQNPASASPMSQTAQLLNKLPGYDTLRALPKVALIGLGAALIALIVALLLWSRGPSYQVLFSNLDDRDGGAIVSALGQMNVPYQFNSNGTAILVPQDRVHDVRMQMASQGLPRSGNAGFELVVNGNFSDSVLGYQNLGDAGNGRLQLGSDGRIGQLVDVVALPVPLQPLRQQRVEQALQIGER